LFVKCQIKFIFISSRQKYIKINPKSYIGKEKKCKKGNGKEFTWFKSQGIQRPWMSVTLFFIIFCIKNNGMNWNLDFYISRKVKEFRKKIHFSITMYYPYSINWFTRVINVVPTFYSLLLDLATYRSSVLLVYYAWIVDVGFGERFWFE